MNSLKDITLESNPYMKINFEGRDLSSDAGLLLIRRGSGPIIIHGYSLIKLLPFSPSQYL